MNGPKLRTGWLLTFVFVSPGFVLKRDQSDDASALVGSLHFVEDIRNISQFTEAFPSAASKKGLQVQMVDDALALGIKHAAINVDLTQLPDLAAHPDAAPWKLDDETLHFHGSFLDQLDLQIKPLSDGALGECGCAASVDCEHHLRWPGLRPTHHHHEQECLRDQAASEKGGGKNDPRTNCRFGRNHEQIGSSEFA